MDIEWSGRNVSASTIERRRRPRYLLSQPLTIHPSPSVALGGIGIEMSESGISAMVNGVLQVGQTVELEPIAGDRAPALVRHKLGQFYGVRIRRLDAAAGRPDCRDMQEVRPTAQPRDRPMTAEEFLRAAAQIVVRTARSGEQRGRP